MGAQQLVRSDRLTRTDRLAAASDHLEGVLESVDIADDPAFAEAVIDAVRATDRAYRLATAR